MRRRVLRCLSGFFAVLAVCVVQSTAGDWPRFRGPNGSGISDSTELPVEFGPQKNLLWKVKVPFGRSSPIVTGDRVFLTASEGNNLITMCLERNTGRIMWQRKIVRERAAEIYKANDPASPTPVTDGTNVYAFFADLGLVSYGPDGNERWRVPMGPFHSFYGLANSPILVGDAVIQLVDTRTDPILTAVHAGSGRTLWTVKRPTTVEGFSTPVVRASEEGSPEILVLGSHRLDAYSAENGETLWWAGGLGYLPKGVPVIGRGFVVVSTSGSDRPSFPPYSETLRKYDANHDGQIVREEVPTEALLHEHFGAVDTNRDGFLDEGEYSFVRMAGVGGYGFAAVSLQDSARQTERKILWRYKKTYPNVPSPILYRDILYSVKNGGIIVAMNPVTGEVLKAGRTKEAMEKYFSSPVAADGKIVMVSESGKVTVLKAGRDWEVLAVNDLGEECWATPAIASGSLYIRARNTLYCFRKMK